MKKFINRILKFLNPELFATDERFEECVWWSNKCIESFYQAMNAAKSEDWEAFKIHRQQHELLSRRFFEAKNRFQQSL